MVCKSVTAKTTAPPGAETPPEPSIILIITVVTSGRYSDKNCNNNYLDHFIIGKCTNYIVRNPIYIDSRILT
nr:hypothetical protein [Tepidanaerobacter sp. GT38]